MALVSTTFTGARGPYSEDHGAVGSGASVSNRVAGLLDGFFGRVLQEFVKVGATNAENLGSLDLISADPVQNVPRVQAIHVADG